MASPSMHMQAASVIRCVHVHEKMTEANPKSEQTTENFVRRVWKKNSQIDLETGSFFPCSFVCLFGQEFPYSAEWWPFFPPMTIGWLHVMSTYNSTHDLIPSSPFLLARLEHADPPPEVGKIWPVSIGQVLPTPDFLPLWTAGTCQKRLYPVTFCSCEHAVDHT